MLSRTFYLLLISACVIMSSAVFAQEGTVGWHLAWELGNEPRQPKRHHVGDGLGRKVLSGVMNPGFDGLQLQNAKLNPKDWTVHFEVDRKENASTVRCMVDGKIDKLGSDRRTLTGT